MNILEEIERGIQLLQEGAEIADRVKDVVKDGLGAHDTTDIADAKLRLEAALERAQEAHDSLNDAIDEQLGA